MSDRSFLALFYLVLAQSASSEAASIKTFDAPGAGTGSTFFPATCLVFQPGMCGANLS
jgi:hypothetical protein